MTSVFKPIRDYYLECYRLSIIKAQRELERVVPELLLEPNGSTETEQLFKLIRVDIIGMRGDRHVIKEVVLGPSELPDGLLGYSCPIALSPSAWHGIELYVAAPRVPEPQLIAWAETWLDPEDLRTPDDTGLQGVIHNIRRPEAVEGGYRLSIDFGSSPLTALHELLELVCAGGATRIDLGSFTLHQSEDSGTGA